MEVWPSASTPLLSHSYTSISNCVLLSISFSTLYDHTEYYKEVGDNGVHWATHGCAKFLLVYSVSECEIGCVQNKVQ